MMLDNKIDFQRMFEYITLRYPNSDRKTIYKNLVSILKSFYERKIIEVDNISEGYVDSIKANQKAEDDLRKEYTTTTITQVDLVVTTGCNFRCRHCFIKDSSYNNENSLDVEKWKGVIQKLCNQGLISVIITGGEPMIYKQLPELLDYVNELGLKIQLLTNGYLIDEEFIKRISAYRNIVVQVSLDGSTSKSNSYQRDKAGAFDKAIKNMKLLRKYGVEVIAAMVLNKHNVNDIYDGTMFKLCDGIGVNVLGITPTVIPIENASRNREDFLEPDQVMHLIRYVKSHIESSNHSYTISIGAPPALVEETSVSKIRKKRSRCRRGTNSFSVRPDGNVCICSDFMEMGYSDYELGNILEDNFDDIIRKLRDIGIDKLERIDRIKGICSICSELEYCGGACRADAYASYKDIDGPYTLCQELYDRGLFPKDKINSNAVYREIV